MSFINDHIHYFIINIYSDLFHLALKYLKDTEVNINNVLVMTGDFNIRNSLWDTSFPHHLSISDDLLIIANSFNLALSSPTNPCPTRYSDMAGESTQLSTLCSFDMGQTTSTSIPSIWIGILLLTMHPSPSPYPLSMKLLIFQNYQFNKIANKKSCLSKRSFRSSKT